jgi:hypothetical protein
MTFEFDTVTYVWTHSREPRGYGGWAFSFDGSDPIWAPSSTYSAAKAWMRRTIKQMAPKGFNGCVVVRVLT